MQRIDAHQHFWIFDPVRDNWISEQMAAIRRDFLPGDLAPLLKENKIEGCIAVQADQSPEETDFLLKLASKNAFIKGVVGWTDLKSPLLEQRLEQYNGESILKGFRHILQGETDLKSFLADGIFEKGVATILERGYTYDLLVYHNQIGDILPMVDRLCRQKDSRLVLDHIGKPALKTADIQDWQNDLRRLAANKAVYCKVSGLVTEADWNHWKPDDLTAALDTVLEAFGPERLMFGSDWPVCLLAVSYGKWVDLLTAYFAPLNEQQKQGIFGGNAARFYGIEI